MTNLTQQNTLTQIKTYYDKEKTKLRERYYVNKNGLKHGLYEWFYENGIHCLKCTYKNNRLDGLYESFYENGKTLIKRTYKNGLEIVQE